MMNEALGEEEESHRQTVWQILLFYLPMVIWKEYTAQNIFEVARELQKSPVDQEISCGVNVTGEVEGSTKWCIDADCFSFIYFAL